MKTAPGGYPFVVTAEARRTADSFQLIGPAVCVPLISSTGHGHASMHRVHYQEDKFALADLLVALLPKDPSQLDCRFLYWLLTAKKDDYFVPLMQGTANVSLKIPDIASVSVPIPAITEQQRAVAKIDRLARKIEEARTLRSVADRYRARLQLCHPAAAFDRAEEQGPNAPLASTVSFRNELIHPHDGLTGRIRFVGLQHVESHTGRKLGEDFIQAEELPGRKFRFKPGDIVYGYLRPYLNKVWIADCDGYCSVDQYVLIPRSDVVDTNYLAAYMRSESFLNQAIHLTHGLMLPRLRSGLFGSIWIPLVPLEEQRRIVAYLNSQQSKMEQLRELYARSSAELEALMPSLLDRVFKGEL